MLWIQFIICVVIVVAASSVLSRYADVIAEKTKFIPYFLWANRGESQMTVWMSCRMDVPINT